MLSSIVKRAMAAEVKRVPIPSRGVDYRGKVVLAPMVRSGELPSRLLALKYGADLVWGPETVDRAMIGTQRRFNEVSRTVEWFKSPNSGQSNGHDHKENIVYRTYPEIETGKLVFQIGSADPEQAVAAARLVAADVAGIDLNAGCPKPFSTSGGMGAALLRTPDKLCAILEALVKNITPEFNIGISVKIRILESAAETEALVRRLVATGITGLTVHCRTTPMRPRERAIRGQLRMVAEICHEAGIPCLMNGDVESKDQGLKLAEEYGADGAMIATAAETNPSCFRTEAEGGILPWKTVVEEYVKTCMQVDNRFGNTKYLLCQMVPGKDAAYKRITSCKSYEALCTALGFENLVVEAKETDDRMGHNKPPAPKAGKKRGASNSSALAAGGQTGTERTDKQRKPLSDRNVSSHNDNGTTTTTDPAPIALTS